MVESSVRDISLKTKRRKVPIEGTSCITKEETVKAQRLRYVASRVLTPLERQGTYLTWLGLSLPWVGVIPCARDACSPPVSNLVRRPVGLSGDISVGVLFPRDAATTVKDSIRKKKKKNMSEAWVELMFSWTQPFLD